MRAFILFTILCTLSKIEADDSNKSNVVKARVESCPGCMLNRLSEVKKFIYDDLPQYDNVEFKKIQGAPPELVLLDSSDNEVKRISLKKLNRQECNELLVEYGFVKAITKSDL